MNSNARNDGTIVRRRLIGAGAEYGVEFFSRAKCSVSCIEHAPPPLVTTFLSYRVRMKRNGISGSLTPPLTIIPYRFYENTKLPFFRIFLYNASLEIIPLSF